MTTELERRGKLRRLRTGALKKLFHEITIGPYYSEEEQVTLENRPDRKLLGFQAPGHSVAEERANARLFGMSWSLLAEVLELREEVETLQRKLSRQRAKVRKT